MHASVTSPQPAFPAPVRDGLVSTGISVSRQGVRGSGVVNPDRDATMPRAGARGMLRIAICAVPATCRRAGCARRIPRPMDTVSVAIAVIASAAGSDCRDARARLGRNRSMCARQGDLGRGGCSGNERRTHCCAGNQDTDKHEHPTDSSIASDSHMTNVLLIRKYVNRSGTRNLWG